jgi:hypothetical protein
MFVLIFEIDVDVLMGHTNRVKTRRIHERRNRKTSLTHEVAKNNKKTAI